MSVRGKGPLWGVKNRVIQVVVRFAPGATSLRVWLHRARGVHIGKDCFISTDALIETSKPHLVWIGNGVDVGVRATILAHFRGGIKADRGEHDADEISVRIEDEAFIGAGAIIMPNVKLGRGCVVNAGSVVTRSVPPMTMVQGNPAVPVAKLGLPLGRHTPLWEFYKHVRPIRKKASRPPDKET